MATRDDKPAKLLQLRCDEVEPLFDAVETIVHPIEPRLISAISRVMCAMLRSIAPRRPRCSRCSSRISQTSSRIAPRCSRTRFV
jgi:hypothetical protein